MNLAPDDIRRTFQIVNTGRPHRKVHVALADVRG